MGGSEAGEFWLVDFPVDEEDEEGSEDAAGDEAEEGEALLAGGEVVDGGEDIGGGHDEGVEEGELEAGVHADEGDCRFGEEHVEGADDRGAEEVFDCLAELLLR